MNAKHTPGPWAVSMNGSFSTDIRAGDPHSGRLIASTAVQTSLPKSYEANLTRAKTNEANARLVAAAPDLLEALKGLLEECRKGVCFEGVSFDHPEVKPAFDAAKAAIAKAEGSAE